MKDNSMNTRRIMSSNRYAVRLAYSLSHKMVICAFIKQIFYYLLWVFYSAYFVKYVLNAITEKKPVKQIVLSVLIIGAVTMLMKAFQFYCENVIFPMEHVRIYQGLYSKIYQKSENVDLKCYEEKSFYDKFSMSLDDMGTKIGMAIDNISAIVGGTIGGILACWAMVEIDHWTILFLIAPLIGNFYIAPKMNKIYYNRYLDSVVPDRKIAYVNRVMYLSEYAKELRLSNISNVIGREYNDASAKKSNIWRNYFKESFFHGFFQYFFSYIVIFEGILLYGGYKALVSKNSPIQFTQMAILTSVMVTASWIWVRVIQAVNEGTKNSVLIDNMKKFFEYKEEIPEDYDGEMPEKEISSIEFCNVSFSYDGVKDTIHNLSFRIEKDMNVAMVGHNGAGKTTIIKLLLRFYDPREGCIKVNGKDIREYNLQAYRQLFSCAFQDYKIFPGTVRYNVLMGRDGTDDEVWEALQLSGAMERVQSMQNGLDTVLTKEFDDKGEQVSGGEGQKIIVARAFVKKTPAAIFDEPSSALDPISENELFNSILESAKNRIGIFVCHRLSCVKDADYVIMLEQGTIIEEGTHQQLMEQKQKYYLMYRTQEKNYYVFDEDGGDWNE